MIVRLANIIKSFPGHPNHTRCFNHVIALVAKSAVWQFDVPKGLADVALDEAEQELKELAEGIDIEEEIAQGEWEVPDDTEEDRVKSDDGWVDEVAGLSITDHEELEENIRPVRLVLVKVSHLFRSNSLKETHLVFVTAL